MQKTAMTIVAIFLMTLFTACASQKTIEQGEANINKPINCAYAKGDIRALMSEKVNVAEEMAQGVTTIVPVGLIASAVEGKTGSDVRVATGDYDKMLDNKIAEIQQKCGVQ